MAIDLCFDVIMILCLFEYFLLSAFVVNDFDVSKFRSFANKKSNAPPLSKKAKENKPKEKKSTIEIVMKNIAKVLIGKRT